MTPQAGGVFVGSQPQSKGGTPGAGTENSYIVAGHEGQCHCELLKVADATVLYIVAGHQDLQVTVIAQIVPAVAGCRRVQNLPALAAREENRPC